MPIDLSTFKSLMEQYAHAQAATLGVTIASTPECDEKLITTQPDDSIFSALGGIKVSAQAVDSMQPHIIWQKPNSSLTPKDDWSFKEEKGFAIYNPWQNTPGQWQPVSPYQIRPYAGQVSIDQVSITSNDPIEQTLKPKIVEMLTDLISEYHFNGQLLEDKPFISGALFAYFSTEVFTEFDLEYWTRRLNDAEYHKQETEAYEQRNV